MGKVDEEERERLLTRIERMSPSLRRTERKMADAIVANPAGVITQSIKSFAEDTTVSEPTVLRFVRKLGCAGYSEFKVRLAQETAVEQMFLRAPEVVANTKVGDVVARTGEAAKSAIDETMAALDISTLEKIATRIDRCDRVFCFGTGGSSAIMAKEAENRLYRLGISVQASSDGYRQQMTAAVARPGDVFLLMSVTGRPASLVNCARDARANGSDVIAITRPGSPVARHATLVLALDVADQEIYFNLPNQARYAQLLALDCIAGRVAVLRQDSAENLSKIRMTLARLHGHVERQPIGD